MPEPRAPACPPRRHAQRRAAPSPSLLTHGVGREVEEESAHEAQGQQLEAGLRSRIHPPRSWKPRRMILAATPSLL
eukprot:8103524-Alexandrium_andersonii.AAC.1